MLPEILLEKSKDKQNCNSFVQSFRDYSLLFGMSQWSGLSHLLALGALHLIQLQNQNKDNQQTHSAIHLEISGS
jgi:hypothetical protein